MSFESLKRIRQQLIDLSTAGSVVAAIIAEGRGRPSDSLTDLPQPEELFILGPREYSGSMTVAVGLKGAIWRQNFLYFAGPPDKREAMQQLIVRLFREAGGCLGASPDLYRLPHISSRDGLSMWLTALLEAEIANSAGQFDIVRCSQVKYESETSLDTFWIPVDESGRLEPKKRPSPPKGEIDYLAEAAKNANNPPPVVYTAIEDIIQLSIQLIESLSMAVPVLSETDSCDEWLMPPRSMSALAAALGMERRTCQKWLQKFGLKREGKQSWTLRLDLLPDDRSRERVKKAE